MRTYASLASATQAFGKYARVEPRLWSLWARCRRAAPPVREVDQVDDVYDTDPFEVDVLAADKPDDGWCAEHYFVQHVKSDLLLLVGSHRPGRLHEMHSKEAFETIYDLLLNWGLKRTCSCCAEHDDDPDLGDDPHPVHW